MRLSALVLTVLFIPLFNQCNTPAEANSSDNNSNSKTIKVSDAAAKTNESSMNTNRIPSANKNPFGLLVAKTDNKLIPPEQQVKVAKALGMQYMRARVDINTWNGTVQNYDTYTSAGLKVLLNINYAVPRDATGGKNPIPFPTDMNAYSKTVNEILDKYKPEVVVIENEEDNPGYHKGPAQDYINELKTAIDICHARGLKVTNGGITEHEIGLLVYDDLLKSGKQKEAAEFAKRAFAPALYNKVMQNAPMVQRQLEFGHAIINAYKTLNLDYVNFHWYEPAGMRGMGQNGGNFSGDKEHVDGVVFTAVVNYLKRITGKPIMTNEFGVLNASPTLITDLMQRILDAGMDYAIFYSADGGVGNAVALQDANGSPRQTGIAARDFIKQHCQ